MIRAAAFLAAAALLAPAHAMAARFAVGVDPGASVPRAQLMRGTTIPTGANPSFSSTRAEAGLSRK